MRYDEVCPAIFLQRPNRFVARVRMPHAEEITVHVKNTGRCRELLLPGAKVYLSHSGNPARKTAYDLIAVEKPTPRGTLLINMDSQAPNLAAGELLPRLLPGLTLLRPEVSHGDSRFDFYAEANRERWFVEVKGVTLEEDGVVRFPDAPTLRGAKHLRGLAAAVQEGYRAGVLFLIQMKGARVFLPNGATDPGFAAALREAAAAGVQIWAYDCAVTPESMTADEPVPWALEG